MVKSDSDEEQDTVGELGNSLPPPRASTTYSPLDWTQYFPYTDWVDPVTPIYWAGTHGPVFLCLHGAGHSALSFACVAKLVADQCRVVGFDFRGHGRNRTAGEEEYDMRVDTLVEDTKKVIQYVRNRFDNPRIILVGHSMGGAIACKTAFKVQNEGIELAGLIVLDVVEGSAIDALPFMESIISQRPKIFSTLEGAIHWSVASQTIRCLESARVSVPLQLKLKEEGNSQSGYVWRTDLKQTQRYWEGWFTNMTKQFLGVHCIKELIVANSDRIDREMMIAQMQGRYKHSIFHDVGHVLQEDNPPRLAHEFLGFANTFRIL
jgi:protein phosphatase methylesterase 1